MENLKGEKIAAVVLFFFCMLCLISVGLILYVSQAPHMPANDAGRLNYDEVIHSNNSKLYATIYVFLSSFISYVFAVLFLRYKANKRNY